MIKRAKLRYFGISIATLIMSANTMAAPVVYLDEAAFLADLVAAGYTVVHEGFEDDFYFVVDNTDVIFKNNFESE